MSTTENGTKVDGLLPMRVKCAKTETEKTIYSKAAAVKDTGAASEEAKKMLTDAVSKLRFVDAKIIGFVFNGVVVSKSGYGYYKKNYKYSKYSTYY